MDKKDLAELKHQLLQIEKAVYRIEQDTIKLSKKLKLDQNKGQEK